MKKLVLCALIVFGLTASADAQYRYNPRTGLHQRYAPYRQPVVDYGFIAHDIGRSPVGRLWYLQPVVTPRNLTPISTWNRVAPYYQRQHPFYRNTFSPYYRWR